MVPKYSRAAFGMSAVKNMDCLRSECFICLDGGGDPLGCACRGNAGFAHLACVEALAMADGRCSDRWVECMTCKQNFTGAMALRLARRRWARVSSIPLSRRFHHEPEVSAFARCKAATHLANALRAHGQHAEAAALHRETLEVLKRVLGKEHPDTLKTAMNLANALSNQGQHAEAGAMLCETIELQKRVLGKEHPTTLTMTMNLANALYNQGQHAAAAAMYRETLEVQKRVLGKDHPTTLTMTTNLANALYNQGQHAAAGAMYRETLEVQKRVLGEKHPDTLKTETHLHIQYTLISDGSYF